MTVIGTTLEVHDVLTSAGLSHAFGGALALAYIIEPRGTVDVDVNVFSPAGDLPSVVEVLSAMDLEPEQDPEHWLPAAGVRLRRDSDPVPVDVFPSLDPRYSRVERRCVTHPFGPERRPLPFLSADDLTLFKLSFGRDRDWVDVRRIAGVRPDLDVAYIEDQLVALRGATMYPRLARLRRLLRDG